MGAGAIGSSLDACLIRAGHEVLLVDTVAEHVAAIAGAGIRLEGREDFTVRGDAVTPDGLAADMTVDRRGRRPPLEG